MFTPQARRWFLKDCGIGLGSVALSHLLSAGNSAAAAADANPMDARPSHFQPTAKNVIFLFMAGAPSHLELFDNKPMLAKFDGTLPPPELIKDYRAAFIKPSSTLLGPKFKFAKHGKCGAELSELLPHMAEVVDDEMMQEFVPRGTYDQIDAVYRERFKELAQRVTFPMPADPEHDRLAAVAVSRLKGES